MSSRTRMKTALIPFAQEFAERARRDARLPLREHDRSGVSRGSSPGRTASTRAEAMMRPHRRHGFSPAQIGADSDDERYGTRRGSFRGAAMCHRVTRWM
jgi:hypothetical protein